MIKESDWKKFKSLKKAALERFCAETPAECSQAIDQADGTNPVRVAAKRSTSSVTVARIH